jgi:hypothetical protein
MKITRNVRIFTSLEDVKKFQLESAHRDKNICLKGDKLSLVSTDDSCFKKNVLSSDKTNKNKNAIHRTNEIIFVSRAFKPLSETFSMISSVFGPRNRFLLGKSKTFEIDKKKNKSLHFKNLTNPREDSACFQVVEPNQSSAVHIDQDRSVRHINYWSPSDFTFFLLKGRNLYNELQEAQEEFSFSYDVSGSISGSDGFVLHAYNLLRK